MSEGHILVVDDDRELRDLLQRFLTQEGFAVTTVSHAAAAREKLQTLVFDLLIVDVMMPGEDGIALTKDLRSAASMCGQTPILILTAKGESEDAILGFEAGADDYLAKPFEPRELSLRVRSILRRSSQDSITGPVVMGAFRYDPQSQRLESDNGQIRLTSAETAILHTLVSASQGVLSRDAIIVRAGLDCDTRAVDVHITRLRRKIETDSKTPRYLVTVRGQGYVLRLD